MKEKDCLKNLPKKIYLEESEMPKACLLYTSLEAVG